MAAIMSGFKDGGQVIVPVLLEFTGWNLWVELIRKDKEKFRSARKIPPSGKRPLSFSLEVRHLYGYSEFNNIYENIY
jgi:hypothetical protein